MKIADIAHSLLNVERLLQRDIQTKLVLTTQNSISWRGYKPGILNNMYYPMEYQWLLDNQQYSYLLSNGAFLQFYYLFNGDGKLKSGRAALYPRPISSNSTPSDIYKAAEDAISTENDDLGDYLLNIVEEFELTGVTPSNTSHLRLDFDASVETHDCAHIQFGGMNNIRISANFFPTPYGFIEIIADALSDLEHPIVFDSGHIAHANRNSLHKIMINKSSFLTNRCT